MQSRKKPRRNCEVPAAEDRLKQLALDLLRSSGAPENALLPFRDRVRSHHELLSALADFYLRDLYTRMKDGRESTEPVPLNVLPPRKNISEARINAILAEVQSGIYDTVFELRLRSGRAIGNLLVCELPEQIAISRYEERLLRFLRIRTKRVDERLPMRRAVNPDVMRKALAFAAAGR